jgi:hypothetical protein
MLKNSIIMNVIILIHFFNVDNGIITIVLQSEFFKVDYRIIAEILHPPTLLKIRCGFVAKWMGVYPTDSRLYFFKMPRYSIPIFGTPLTPQYTFETVPIEYTPF